MKVHITCSYPSRSLVLAVHAARELLRSCGHDVGLSWPESWLEDGDFRRSGLNRKTLNEAEIIVQQRHRRQTASEIDATMNSNTGANGRQRWEVVHSITDHRYYFALCL